MKEKFDIEELFDNAKKNKTYLKVCAPMVRYSKVQFRTLVRSYGVDLCFTPMIMADSFCQNEKARTNEFSTTINDTPLILQFAANNVDDFVDAAKLIHPYADGVDLNCGCPQRWAMKDGYGCALLSKPEVVSELVRGIRNDLPHNFSVSVKIRISKILKKTIDMCRQLEKCGVTFLTVHGRTPEQKCNDSVDIQALKDISESISIPVIANGGVRTLENADRLHFETNCSGVMAASGMLTNPTLFSGTNQTSLSCVKHWMDMKNLQPNKITFQCYHHHLVFMLEKILSKQQKQIFNYLSDFESVDSFLFDNLISSLADSEPKYNLDEFVACQFADEILLKHSSKCRGCGRSMHYCICNNYDYNAIDGSFFRSCVETDEDVFIDSNLFFEPS